MHCVFALRRHKQKPISLRVCLLTEKVEFMPCFWRMHWYACWIILKCLCTMPYDKRKMPYGQRFKASLSTLQRSCGGAPLSLLSLDIALPSVLIRMPLFHLLPAVRGTLSNAPWELECCANSQYQKGVGKALAEKTRGDNWVDHDCHVIYL